MQGSIAQVIALTAYGNSFLQRTSDASKTGFYPSNSTFKFCEYVRFFDLQREDKQQQEPAYASDPAAWFERLKRDSVHALRMSYSPSGEKKVADRMLVGFVGGGGRWLIETLGPIRSDYWKARWEVGDSKRTDQKIWRVTCGRIASGTSSSVRAPEAMDELKEKLNSSLVEIEEFARSHKLESFARAFESALLRLKSSHPYRDLHHLDITAPDALPLVADQLLGAAQDAWVFGGMGSWNDVSFQGKDQVRYEDLSERLYGLLNKVIVAAANSSIRSELPPRKRWLFWN